VIVMPASEPRTPPPPAAPIDARQLVADTLTAIAVRLDTRQPPADALSDLIDALGHKGLVNRVVIALIAAAYADSEQTAALLDDLASASTRLDRHRATTGHDECCGGNCPCLGWMTFGRRCQECEGNPADWLWSAQDHLRHHLETLKSWPHLLRPAQDTT